MPDKSGLGTKIQLSAGLVIPAKAGIYVLKGWMPAFAGMTL
jgi:hypothetical protein